MKRLAMAVALSCALSITALAADIPTTDSPTPPPGDIPTLPVSSPGDIPTTDSPSPGDIPSGGWSVVLTIVDLAF